jgi:hypothetical protein
MRCVAYNSTAAVMPRGRQCDLPYEAQHRLSDVMYFVSVSCGDVTASFSSWARWTLASRFGSHSASTHRQVSAEASRLRGCSMQLTLGRALQVSTSVGDTERREIRLWAGHHERHEMAASAHDAVLKAVGDGEPATPISSIAGSAAVGGRRGCFNQQLHTATQETISASKRQDGSGRVFTTGQSGRSSRRARRRLERRGRQRRD